VGLLSIYAATFLNIGWGLSVVYLVLVNALAHILAAVLWREYNPGLWTALVLFVPVGTLALFEIARLPGVEPIHHVVGLAVAVAIHAAIVVHTRGRAAKIAKQPLP
jgi:hypothetical protein